ncbi:MAG: CpaF family protein [Actinobacteria bacterium]|nr:CpaF family protein [Actinomycetota bacterium]
MSEPTPLSLIEESVQQRAMSIAVDMDTPEGRDALRALIGEAIEHWQYESRSIGDHRALIDPGTIAERAWRNLAENGPLTSLLADPDVWEIEINSPSEIFVKRHRGSNGYHQETFHDDDHVLRTLARLLDRSSGSHRRLDPTEGLQDAQLDDGSRLHIVHGDIARGGHCMVNIRRFTGVAYTHLEELVSTRTLSDEAARFLAGAVRVGASIVFAGAPGSGKTTLLSCCLGELDPSLRVVTAEEVFEIDAPLANVASMQTRAARSDRPEIDLRRLVSGFLRMAPDVAVVGEVRDREALPLLLTLSSGVRGFTTIHASNARGALSRLRLLAELSDAARNLPHSALTSLVSESIDLVVFSERSDDGPRVREIIAVEDRCTDPSSGAFTVTELFRTGAEDELRWCGTPPQRLLTRLRFDDGDIEAMLRDGPAARR